MSQSPKEASSLVLSLTLQRSDGAGYALSNHDCSLDLSGNVIEPHGEVVIEESRITDAMIDSALELSTSCKVAEALTRSVQSEERSGQIVARVEVLDWTNNADPRFICEGALGNTEDDNHKLRVNVRVTPQSLLESACIQTSPQCRARLGEQLCRIDMRGRHERIRITGQEGGWLSTDRQALQPFLYGELRWISGPHSSEVAQVVDVQDGRLRLHRPPTSISQGGDTAILSEGCDRTRTTCSERFGNVLNFRGEPDLPGTDRLLRYPGA